MKRLMTVWILLTFLATASGLAEEVFEVESDYGDTGLFAEEGEALPESIEVYGEPAAEIALEDMTLGVGETRALPSGCTYASSKTKIVSVDENGIVNGLKVGSATVTVSETQKITVTVKPAPTSLTLSAKKLSLGVGQTRKLKATRSKGSASAITWESSDAAVVSVDPSGYVTAVSCGSAVVTARTYKSKIYATCKVSVSPAPESVSLSKQTYEMYVGQTRTFEPQLLPEDARTDFTWETTDAAVVKVEDGKLTAKAVGEAVVSVTAHNGKSALLAVSVFKAPKGISLNKTTLKRKIGQTYALVPTLKPSGCLDAVSWSSSDKKIVTVDEYGQLLALKSGTAKITAKTKNGLKAVCTVTVIKAPSKVTLSADEKTLGLGESCELTATMPDGTGSALKWMSSDENVVAVDGGTLTALGLGTATVTVETYNGKRDTCAVTVKHAPTGMTLSVGDVLICDSGAPGTIRIKPIFAEDECGSVTYAIEDESIATIGVTSGKLKLRCCGDTVITVTAYNGVTATCRLSNKGGPLAGKVIGIDPGHQAEVDHRYENSYPNGKGKWKYAVSYGCHGSYSDVEEHTVNLSVSLYLRKYLEAMGATVIMTRTGSNAHITNIERAQLMNENHVDLWLRIHCNYAAKSSVNGCNIYVRESVVYSKDKVKDPAGLLKKETKLGKCMLNAMSSGTGIAKGKLLRSNAYTGNNWSLYPCVLVEMGYMSNSHDDRLLSNTKNHPMLAKALAKGICDYFGVEPIWY